MLNYFSHAPSELEKPPSFTFIEVSNIHRATRIRESGQKFFANGECLLVMRLFWLSERKQKCDEYLL